MENSEVLLDINQAADFLQVSVTSLRRWTDSGKLACLRVGVRRERRFRKSDLLAFMEDQPGNQPSAEGATEVFAAKEVVIGGFSVPYGSHYVGFYSEDAGRLKLALSYLVDGLRVESVCFLATNPKCQQKVVEALEGDFKDLPEMIRKGRLVLSEYAHTAKEQLDYWEKGFIKAVRSGAKSLRVVGDVTELIKALSPDERTAYEAEYDRLARRFPVVTKCLYDARLFSGTEMLRVLKSHPDMFRYPADRLLA